MFKQNRVENGNAKRRMMVHVFPIRQGTYVFSHGLFRLASVDAFWLAVEHLSMQNKGFSLVGVLQYSNMSSQILSQQFH